MAIAEKDFKEFMRNMMLLTMPILPILMAFMFTASPIPNELKGNLGVTVLAICFVSVITIGMMTMMAEEKEKNTLRGLINSPASMFDIMVGKSIVLIIMFFISAVTCCYILKYNPIPDWKTFLSFIMLLLFFLSLGVMVGLIVKSVSQTSLYSLPVLFIFAMSPNYINMGIDKDTMFMKANEYTPMMQHFRLSETGDIKHLIFIALWLLICIIITAFLFKKNSID
ncbi:ABC transporter permease [Macrococcus animalis]|uniref:ABC transporter permease n=1 Tax=Macrococcus animalis TaxID=3395467 RepID=UPI0039BE7D9F